MGIFFTVFISTSLKDQKISSICLYLIMSLIQHKCGCFYYSYGYIIALEWNWSCLTKGNHKWNRMKKMCPPCSMYTTNGGKKASVDAVTSCQCNHWLWHRGFQHCSFLLIVKSKMVVRGYIHIQHFKEWNVREMVLKPNPPHSYLVFWQLKCN